MLASERDPEDDFDSELVAWFIQGFTRILCNEEVRYLHEIPVSGDEIARLKRGD